MLRNRESPRVGSFRRTGRLVTVLLLAGLAAALSTLRSPAQAVQAPVADDKTSNRDNATRSDSGEAAQNGHDITQLRAESDDLIGVFTFRPNVFFALPGMKSNAEVVNKALGEMIQEARERLEQQGLEPATVLPAVLPVEKIDLVSFPVYLRGASQNADGMRTLFFSLEMIRSANPFDWKQFLHKATVDLTEIEIGSKSILKTTGGLPLIFPVPAPGVVLFHVPDDRTLVFPNDEQKLRGMFEAGKDWRPLSDSYEALHRVQHGFFALAIDNHDNQVGRKALKEDDELEPVLAPLFENTRSFSLSLEARERLVIEAIAECETGEAAQIVAEHIKALLTLARNAAERREKSTEGIEEQTKMFEAAMDSLKHTRVVRDGTMVIVRSEAKVDLAQLTAAVLMLGL